MRVYLESYELYLSTYIATQDTAWPDGMLCTVGGPCQTKCAI